MTTTKIADVVLKLGQAAPVADGTYFGVATWSTAQRDYLDVPGVYASEPAAREGGGGATGSRLVRFTVHGGSVTTRKGLR